MKNRKRVGDIAKKALIAFLAATIAFTSFAPVYVEAKTTTVKLTANDYVNNATETKAKKITKKGTYNIKVKTTDNYWYKGWMKFKAPKTATYSFVFSNVNSKKKPVSGYVLGSFATEYGSWMPANFSTKGGKSEYLYLASKKSYDRLTKRTGKIKLKKGQEIYLYFEFQKQFKGKAGTMSIKLNVK